MNITKHAQQRMSQRGITRNMIELALEYGVIEGDKAILTKRQSEKLIREFEDKLRTAKKICDKGGCVVVESADAVVTAYNFTPSH